MTNLAPKLGEERMLPKMRKWWMHCEIGVMKEAVAGNREVAPELEERPGSVGPGIHLEKSWIGWVCFFPSRFVLWDSNECWCRWATSHATSAICAHVIDSIKHLYGSFHLPSYEIRGSFTRDQFTCVQFFCNTTRSPRHFFADSREGGGPSPGE